MCFSTLPTYFMRVYLFVSEGGRDHTFFLILFILQVEVLAQRMPVCMCVCVCACMHGGSACTIWTAMNIMITFSPFCSTAHSSLLLSPFQPRSPAVLQSTLLCPLSALLLCAAVLHCASFFSCFFDFSLRRVTSSRIFLYFPSH